MKNVSQSDLIKEFYTNNSNRDIQHEEAVDWLTTEYLKITGSVFRDPDRGIRKLAQEGFLIKISKRIYRYDPEFENKRDLEDFTEKQKSFIKKRDGYKCVVCGASTQNGVDLHIDQIKPKEFGGKADVENGQTLCEKHNYLKKTFKQTETGKKMFIRLYELAKSSRDQSTMAFCEDVLNTFEKHRINGHIKWKK